MKFPSFSRIGVFLSVFLLSGCGSPILNPAPAREGSGLRQSDLGTENLLAVYGCPISFEEIGLCARIRWFDDLGTEVAGPIYWESFGGQRMSATLYFWEAEEGWPIDPIEEFEKVVAVQIKLYMPTHGHGSDFPRVSRVKSRVGQFRVEALDFIMDCSASDPWEVRVQLRDRSLTAQEDPHDPFDPHVFSQAILEIEEVEKR